MLESVLPVPLLPARSVTPVLSRLMRLLVSVMLAVGVSVAVQVMPPPALLKPLNTPLATLKSAVVSPVTASLKVMVTVVVSPAASALSATTMLALGRTVSMA
ncbi:hypothetical protein D3C85_1211630 [compost metagenome]